MAKKRTSGKPKLPKEFLDRLESVTARRARIVIDHILKHGFVTTEELREEYGYSHPPRAARDVRERGIPLETFRVTGKRGRKIAAYKFVDLDDTRGSGFSGRRAWPRNFKKTLTKLHGSRCGICFSEYESRHLQIDHRVPFEISGDSPGTPDPSEFMLVCGSCNRAKSWSCEHCRNWSADRSVEVCKSCYWAAPRNHVHVALMPVRRLDLVWSDDQVSQYERLVRVSKREGKRLPEFVKDVLRRALDGKPD